MLKNTSSKQIYLLYFVSTVSTHSYYACNFRQATALTKCVRNALKKCDREVAMVFANFFYAGYTVYGDD